LAKIEQSFTWPLLLQSPFKMWDLLRWRGANHVSEFLYLYSVSIVYSFKYLIIDSVIFDLNKFKKSDIWSCLYKLHPPLEMLIWSAFFLNLARNWPFHTLPFPRLALKWRAVFWRFPARIKKKALHVLNQ
jgi:hypothetical protein